jgi:predicted transcriptional regulator
MAMTLRLSAEDTEALRRQAEREDRSMQDVVQGAIREYISRRTLATRVGEALDVLTPRYAELLERLGE